MSMFLYAINIGSNVGNRERHLSSALARIASWNDIRVIATSHIYESKGWGGENLDDFLNAVAVIASNKIAPDALLKKLRHYEDQRRRQRTVKWGPRTLDLDIMACNDLEENTETLTLPHPYISDRPFFYLPFREVSSFHDSWKALTHASDEGKKIEHETWRFSDSPAWGTQEEAVKSIDLILESESQTEQFGRTLAPFLAHGYTLALDAPMGTGKSVLARSIARGLGIEERIQSPTFTLCRQYNIPDEDALIEHWDFYRLSSIDDLDSAGFFDRDPRRVLRLIEWAEMFPEALPENAILIKMNPIDESRRRISITLPAKLENRPLSNCLSFLKEQLHESARV